MILMKYEWKKLFTMPALWVLVALCLAFNGLVIYNYRNIADEFNQMSSLARELGQQVDSDFIKALESMERTDLEDNLLTESKTLTNIYEDYILPNYTESYSAFLNEHILLRWLLQREYQSTVMRVEHLAETEQALNLYAGTVTQDAFSIQCTYLRVIVIEGVLLGALSMLLLWDYEKVNKTLGMVCASRTGRGVYRKKVMAGVTGALTIYFILSAISMAMFFLMWDYRGVWGASMSSAFLVNDGTPFIPWADFTVLGYQAASISLGAAFVVIFALMGAACVGAVKNIYAAALLMIVVCLIGWNLVILCQSSPLAWAVPYLFLQPTWIIRNIHIWFSGGSGIAVTCWFETVTAGIHLFFMAVVSGISLRRFERKDV